MEAMARVLATTLLLALLTACGGGPRHTSNALLATSEPLSAVGAPHVGLVVSAADGFHRVWLDSGRVELLEATAGAVPVGETTFVLTSEERFVIRRGRERAAVPGVHAIHGAVMSHDGRRFAALQDDRQIAVVAIADATVQRVPLPSLASAPASSYRSGVSFVWAKDGAALFVSDGEERYRLELATGARTPSDALDWKVNAPLEPTECPARGLRLERRVTRDRQELVLVPLAGASDPEHVASVGDRVLVASTNHPAPWRGRGVLGPRPGELRAASFTPACDYFVFSLEDRIFVGSIATGRIAFLMRGSPVWLPTAPPPGGRMIAR
jgi:hypothetical protein